MWMIKLIVLRTGNIFDDVLNVFSSALFCPPCDLLFSHHICLINERKNDL